MFIFLTTLLGNLSAMFRSRAVLQLENLALRHQIGVLQRSVKNGSLEPVLSAKTEINAEGSKGFRSERSSSSVAVWNASSASLSLTFI